MEALNQYWQEAVAAVSVGGGGFSVFGYKKRIKKLAEEVNKNKSEISEIKSSLAINTELDKSLRRELNDHKTELNSRLDRIENNQQSNFNTIISLIKK